MEDVNQNALDYLVLLLERFEANPAFLDHFTFGFTSEYSKEAYCTLIIGGILGNP